MIIGLYSPLPPAPTGVADYSAALAQALGERAEVRLNSDGDVNVYQLGNNHLHLYAYRRALARPGVVVLHDAVMHHFFLGTLGRDQYVAEFVYNSGAWHESLAAGLWEGRAKSATDPRYFAYPMLKRILESAVEVIVHNDGALRTAGRGVVIPHLFADPGPVDGSDARRELGVAPGTLLAGVFGHLRESKRVLAALRAVDELQRAGKRVELLLAGDFVSRDLERAVAQSGIMHHRRPYLPEADFWRYAAAVDVCINLRYPAAGESSGIGVRLMGVGKPVIFTRSEENAAFPEGSCLLVDSGTAELEMLKAYLLWLTDSPEAVSAIGDRARRHIATHHRPDQVAERYLAVLTSALASGTGKTRAAETASTSSR